MLTVILNKVSKTKQTNKQIEANQPFQNKKTHTQQRPSGQQKLHKA